MRRLTSPLVQARLRVLAMGFFVLCLVCYIFIGWGTCVSFLQVSSRHHDSSFPVPWMAVVHL